MVRLYVSEIRKKCKKGLAPLKREVLAETLKTKTNDLYFVPR